MSQRIWAHFTTFEGVDYIAPLNNAADHLHAELIFEPDPARSVKTVYIAENHLGARQIIFHHSETPLALEPCEELWWRNLHLKGPTKLVLQSD
ncbi:hypothetical protein CH063_03745, partial [Colletotrichum higginsianum]